MSVTFCHRICFGKENTLTYVALSVRRIDGCKLVPIVISNSMFRDLTVSALTLSEKILQNLLSETVGDLAKVTSAKNVEVEARLTFMIMERKIQFKI